MQNTPAEQMQHLPETFAKLESLVVYDTVILQPQLPLYLKQFILSSEQQYLNLRGLKQLNVLELNYCKEML